MLKILLKEPVGGKVTESTSVSFRSSSFTMVVETMEEFSALVDKVTSSHDFIVLTQHDPLRLKVAIPVSNIALVLGWKPDVPYKTA